ncbi:MAG: peptidoglycan editing factor PgeF [Ignavibacteria bacterium]|nr:peptidoglycan editing factor PgeF [Ignavibacteria bacterium]
MEIIKSELLSKYENIIFGISTKIGLERAKPFYFNLSYNVGDKLDQVNENRNYFYSLLGIRSSQVAHQKQIHSEIISIIDQPGLHGESDAMITIENNLGLAISTADCASIFIYDYAQKIIAAVHSGWRGSQKQIVRKTLNKLVFDFNSKPENLLVYIGPSITQKNYEVGIEVAELFSDKYILELENKFFLDVILVNLDLIKAFDIPDKQIEVSQLCTFEENKLLHSYRRDGQKSGRALGIIYMKKN